LEIRQWHYVVDDNRAGPVSEPELVEMLASGQLDPETLVWTQTLEEWVAASGVDELMNPVPVPAAPEELESVPVPAETTPAETAPATSVPEEVIEVTYAGFWKRFAAAIIDGIIMTVASSFFMVAARFIALHAASATGFFGYTTSIVVRWLYYALMESSPSQATVGKMALGIKVTDYDGNCISFGRATGRHFGKIVSSLTLLIGYLMVAFTPRKQGLHDIMAGCLVVNRDA